MADTESIPTKRRSSPRRLFRINTIRHYHSKVNMWCLVLIFFALLLDGNADARPQGEGLVPFESFKAAMIDVNDRPNIDADIPISQGDRLLNGQGLSPGLGIFDRDLGPILNIEEINRALETLSKVFPEMRLQQAGLWTSQGHPLYRITIGKPRVLIHSGLYGHDRGGPDHLLYFLSDLLHAHKRNLGLQYGNKAYTAQDVAKALSAGIVAVPLVNPDGVEFDHGTDLCWSKNRRAFYPNRFLPTSEVGVNINRNFDFLWDFESTMNASLPQYFANTSTQQDFRGLQPSSEPETVNMMMASYENSRVSWFVGLYSTPGAGSVSWGWSHAESQSTDVHQNFKNSSYDGRRAFIQKVSQHEFLTKEEAQVQYAEYMDLEAVQSQLEVCRRITNATRDTGGNAFAHHPNFIGDPTSGNSADWAASGYYAHDCRRTRVNTLNINFGRFNKTSACGFYPNRQEHYNSMRQVGASLMEVLLYAADETPKQWQC